MDPDTADGSVEEDVDDKADGDWKARLGFKKAKLEGSDDTSTPDPREKSSTASSLPVDDMYLYNMRHKNRGSFYIINNKKFQPITGMGERTGTDIDAANLYQQFKQLGFNVTIEKDLTTTAMLKLLINAAKKDHTDSDCFGCAILSHGDEHGLVYGVDGIVEVESLVAPFKGDVCPTLLGKPKLFFIQACRGRQTDAGAAQSDTLDPMSSTKKVKVIPIEADFLYAYSTVPGYYSWRNPRNGSWFVQALCQKLQEFGQSRDLMWIMTRVNQTVAYDFESSSSGKDMNKKKQIPSVVSTLTKDIFFKPKH